MWEVFALARRHRLTADGFGPLELVVLLLDVRWLTIRPLVGNCPRSSVQGHPAEVVAEALLDAGARGE